MNEVLVVGAKLTLQHEVRDLRMYACSITPVSMLEPKNAMIVISFCSLFIINYLKPCMINNTVDYIYSHSLDIFFHH